METITSTEFRKRYASLRKATVVTVNGHTIGTWTPQNLELTADNLIPRIAGFGTSRPAPKPKR